MVTKDETRSLRIGMCIDRWDPARGGAERALCSLVRWLENRGHDVWTFGLSASPGAPGKFVGLKARGWTRGARERALGRGFRAGARARDCHVTLGVRHIDQVDVLWPHGGAHAETLRALGKRARGRHRAFLDLERAAIAGGGARRIVCVSEMVRKEMLAHYPGCGERLRVVPNGVDLDQFNVGGRGQARRELLSMAGWSGNGPVLTFVARNPSLKGLDVLLAALRILESKPWRLVIAGPRDLDSIKRQVEGAFKDRSRFFVAQEVEARILAGGSDLLVLPSRRDPCGLVVLEALGAGTPVLVSDCVGAGDAIQSALQGEVFPVGEDGKQLALRIAGRLDGMGMGADERKSIAAAVAHRGLSEWLAAMEGQLLEVAR